MTTSYTNMLLPDVEPMEAAAWLADNGVDAYVSPSVDNTVVVYDRLLSKQGSAPPEDTDPIEHLLALSSEISYELGCIALMFIVDNDASLIYSLYMDGELVDGYGVGPDGATEGGDAEQLCDVLGLPKRQVKTVRAALRRAKGTATERHAALLKALDLPLMALGAGYDSIHRGVLPNGVDTIADLVHVEVDDAEDHEDLSS